MFEVEAPTNKLTAGTNAMLSPYVTEFVVQPTIRAYGPNHATLGPAGPVTADTFRKKE